MGGLEFVALRAFLFAFFYFQNSRAQQVPVWQWEGAFGMRLETR